jgi:hypothetical protein
MNGLSTAALRRRLSNLDRPVRACIESLENRWLLSTNSWKSAVSGDWDTASNWSAGHVPTASEDAVISLAGSYSVTHSTGASDSVHSLTTSKPLNFSSGTLTVATSITATSTVTLAGGTIIGATLTAGSGGSFIVNGDPTLQDVTLGESISVPSTSTLLVQKTLNLNGHNITLNAAGASATLYFEALSGETAGPSLTGTGAVILGGTTPANNIVYAYDYLHPTTISSGVTMEGAGNIYVGYASPGGLNNQGKITANISGQALNTSGAGTLNNTGNVSATGGGIMTLGGVWTNSGTLNETSSTLNLGGTFSHTGTVTRSAGTINITGTANLSGGTLAFTATTGSWNLLGGTIENAVMTSAGGASLLMPAGTSGTFYNATLGADFSVPATSTLYVEQAVNLNGHNLNLNAAASSATLYFEAFSRESTGPSLTGAGAVILGGTTPANNIVYAYDYLHPTTISSGVTLEGAGNIYVGYASPGGLNNAGKLSANISGQTLATSGAGTLSSTGTVSATGGGIMTLGGVWTNSGTLNEVSSTLNLGGTFNKTGTVTRTAGAINITGTANLSGGTLAFTATTGSWNLVGGTLENATITAAGGASLLLPAASSGTLLNVKLGANFIVPGSSTLYVEQALNLNGFNIMLNANASSATLYFEALSGESTGPSITGTGAVILGGTSPANNIVYAYDYLHPTTIASTATLEGAGNIYVGYASPGGLNNQGMITANTSGQALITSGAGTLTNTGTVSATGGGIMTLGGVWTNSGTLNETSSTLNLAGTFSKVGTVTRTAGTINITGTANLSGGTLAFTATTGSFNLMGGTVENATLTSAGGATLLLPASTSGTLANVKLGTNFSIPASATLYVEQGLNLNGFNVTLNSTSASSATIYFEALSGETTGPSVTGTGSILLAGTAPANNIFYAYDYLHPTTIGSGVSVEGLGNIYVGYAAPGGLINSGTIFASASGGTLTISGAGALTNKGIINIASGATLAITSTGWTNATGGTITGVGKLAANVSNSGVIQAGSPLFGTLTITGNLVQSATGSIKVEIGGSASSSFNKLVVTGSATLAGILDIYTVSGYTPTAGTSFSVVSFASKTGTLGTDGSVLSGSIALSETLGGTSVSLKAVAAASDSIAPTVSGFTTSNTNTSSATFTFTVTYADNVAISIASLGNGNLKVTGPGGFSAFATLVSVSKSNNGTPRSATYSISTSAGSGGYTVTAVAGSVKDTKGNALAAGKVGVFTLNKT